MASGDGVAPMVDFTRRGLTDAEATVVKYEAFVATLSDGTGYGMCQAEYANDISCRQRLEDARTDPEVARLWARVEAADAQLKLLLLPTKRCIHGNAPQSCFWFWGYPANSPELERDLVSLGML